MLPKGNQLTWKTKFVRFTLRSDALQHQQIQMNPWTSSNCRIPRMLIRHPSLSLSIVSNKMGEKTVWHRGAASGLDKCQCTVQLTVFADGEARVPPLLIFRGKGLRISQAEKTKYNQRMRVQFQENVWCDEDRMLHWVNQMWKCPFSPNAEKPKLLIADVHKAQKTTKVLNALEACKTTVAFVPPGCTSLVQPLDVVVNAKFKQIVDHLQTEHM